MNQSISQLTNQYNSLTIQLTNLDVRVSALENNDGLHLIYTIATTPLFPQPLNNGWDIRVGTNTVYYRIYEIVGNITDFYLTTQNTYRTRYCFSNYDPILFLPQVTAKNAFIMQGLESVNLSDQVNHYHLVNPNATYFYLYTGNYLGDVLIEY